MEAAKHKKRARSVKEKVAHRGFQASAPDPDHWMAGAAVPRFGGEDINPAGDWTPYKAADEAQNQYFETMGCALFGTAKAYVSLAKFHGFADFPTDIAERFLGVVAGTNEYGTDVHVVAEAIRTMGLVPQAELPWTSDLTSMATYYTPKPMDGSIARFAKAFLDKFTPGHEWIFALGNSYAPADKAVELKAALKRGTVCVSVLGWQQDKKGLYTKKKGAGDNHWVQLIRYEGDNPVIHDSYPPFEKKLAASYDFGVAKVYFLKRNTTPRVADWWDGLWSSFAKVWAKLAPVPDTRPESHETAVKPATSTVPSTVPESVAKASALDTFCAAIRDFEGKPGDLNYRNNNPGNFRCSPVGYLPKYGNVKCRNNFAVFPSYELGWEYLQATVLSWAHLHPNWTIRDFFYHYAPPSDDNPTETYAATIARKCGVPVDTQLAALFA